MAFAPDFGLMLLNDGAPQGFKVTLIPYVMDYIAIVTPEEFTTTSNVQFNGIWHAATVDFDIEVLADIISICTDEAAQRIEDWVVESTEPNMIQLIEPVNLVLEAELGAILTNKDEQFIPLIAKRVSKYSGDVSTALIEGINLGLKVGQVKLEVEQGLQVGTQFVLDVAETLVGRKDKDSKTLPHIDLKRFREVSS